MKNPLDYTGKVVLITGASSGIGQAAALAFAEHGARVVIGDISEGAARITEQIRAGGGQASYLPTDVRHAAQVQALIGHAVEKYGRLDCAFNNAGVLPVTAPLHEQTEEDFHRIIGVDLLGVFLCMKYEIQHMLGAGGGAIVKTASVAGVIADPGMAPYVAAKHGVVGLTRAAGIEYAQQGIRVNALAPGFVQTPMTQRWLDDPQMRDFVMTLNPMQRPARGNHRHGAVSVFSPGLLCHRAGLPGGRRADRPLKQGGKMQKGHAAQITGRGRG